MCGGEPRRPRPALCLSAMARSLSWPTCNARSCAYTVEIAMESLGDPTRWVGDSYRVAVRRGLVRHGLMAPPEAYGLPPNDALQQTNALWSAASPPLMIGVRS